MSLSRPRPTFWGYWGVPLRLLSCLFLAAVVGLGQHFLYSCLAGQPVSSSTQPWILRGGTAISYLVKIIFAYALTLALRQWVWRELRSKSWTLGAVDDLFSLTFWRPGVMAGSPIGLAIAIILLTLPLLPIIAPPSLSVTQAELSQDNVPTVVQTLNLSRSRQNLQDAGLGYTVNFASLSGSLANPNSYGGLSTRANALLYGTIYNGRIATTSSPCGSNCSFSQTFFGPAYKCSEVDYTQVDSPGNPFSHGAEADQSFSFSGKEPNSFTWYRGLNSTCDGTQVCRTEGWQEGKIWILQRYLLPEARGKAPDVTFQSLPDSSWEKHQIMCQSYNATYTILRTYSAGAEETVTQTSLTYNNPLDFTEERMGSGDERDMQPEYAGYAIHQTLFSILRGEIGPDARSSATDTTGLAGTQLVEREPYPLLNLSIAASANTPGSTGIQKPVRSLARAIEQLHFNVTVGLLSIAQLIYLQNETVAARTASTEPRWAYSPLPLLAVYGVFFAASLGAVVLALVAVAGNGGVGVLESGFLRALMTTRSADFDAVVVGEAGRGEDFHQQRLRDAEVRFHVPEQAAYGEGEGAQMASGVAPVVGFGLRERVMPFAASKA